MKKYQEVNRKAINKWANEGWIWAEPITSEQYSQAKNGNFQIYLTPTKVMPRSWLPENLQGMKVLGLASGGGQQMPILQALGANVVCLDISDEQLKREEEVAIREGYKIELIRADMTQQLPFEDEEFDLIIHPVSNVYIKDVDPVFKECYRILKKDGILLSGLDNGFNFAFDDEDGKILFPLPFNPLEDQEQYDFMVENDYGIQFSHTIEEQIGGQLKAGFTLVDLYDDTNREGKLHEFNITTFIATKVVKK